MLDLRKERYEFVIHRQEYLSDRMQAAFQFYIKIFSFLVIAGFTLVSKDSTIRIGSQNVPLFLYVISSVISVVGIVTIVQIWISLINWKGFRSAEIELNRESPEMSKLWWLFEALYSLIIIGSIVLSWCGALFLIKIQN